MNYETTKNLMMDAYPSLFPEEADALHHLFFVLGNGYDWVGGELTENYSDPTGVSPTPAEIIEECKIRRREFLKRTQKQFGDLGGASEYLEKELRIIETSPAEQRQHELRRRKLDYRRKMYPICEYSRILHLPEDIKEDWLEAATKALGLANGLFETTEEDREWLSKAAQIIELLTK